jgi:hypothetical protein
MNQVDGIAMRASAVGAGSVVSAAKAEMGTRCSAPSAGEDRKSQARVTLWAPSAPIRSVPCSVVPSSKAALTPSSVVVMEASLLPYWERKPSAMGMAWPWLRSAGEGVAYAHV